MKFPYSLRKPLSALLTAAALFGSGCALAADGDSTVDFWLTLLHNNDGESQLIDAGTGLEDFGGIARFATQVDRLRLEAVAGRRDDIRRASILVSSGDNYLAGPEFNASVQTDFRPFYDALALSFIRYDAMAIGNHEFDFGPDILARFINATRGPIFLSANLDVSAEPSLARLERLGRIAGSTVIRRRGQRIGIVGATTPRLPFISSPRNVVVDPDVAGIVQAEVDRLTARGVDKIILISHLQSVDEDLALLPLLHDVDVAVAGGGDELLANEGALLVPGDEEAVFGPYPLTATDADGQPVPVVTTSGDYRYVGRLVVGFDAAGEVTAIDAERSGPVRVAGGDNPDAVTPNPIIQRLVVDPVQASIDSLAANVIATSEVVLDGTRTNIRTVETNEGNLVADALLTRAAALATDFGAPLPDVALQNGGGIRNAAEIPAGDFTELDTFNILPFSNFLSVVPAIPAAQFKEILENAVSRVEFTDGRFAQISGFRYTWDAAQPARELDDLGNVTQEGSRVREVVLDDGTVIVADGVVVDGAPDLNIATIDFLANGGDQYPFGGVPFDVLGVSYQQALLDYVVEDLGGVISAADYPEGGEGRITRLN